MSDSKPSKVVQPKPSPRKLPGAISLRAFAEDQGRPAIPNVEQLAEESARAVRETIDDIEILGSYVETLIRDVATLKERLPAAPDPVPAVTRLAEAEALLDRWTSHPSKDCGDNACVIVADTHRFLSTRGAT